MDLLQKADRIKQLSSRLGLIIPVVYLKLEHRDKNGILYPNGEYYNVARSWVRNPYNFMISRIGGTYADDATPNWGTGYLNIKDTSGTIRSGSVAISFSTSSDSANLETTLGFYAAAGASTHGIQVGTGSGAESFEDYTLTLIAHGTGSGQLSYGAMSRAESDASLTHKHTWTRVITHLGLGQPDVTINEAGMVMRLYFNNNLYYTMLLRDIGGDLPKTLTYLDTLTVTYETALTYPS